MRRSYVSPRDLAAAIEVSESSLKRWADGGLLRVVRTAGGHRRIPVTEAIRFVRDAKIRVADPSRLGLPGIGATSPEAGLPTTEQLRELLLAHQGAQAASAMVRAFLAGTTVDEICDGPLRGALSAVGHLFEDGPEGIAIEHAAVDACIQALHSIRQALPPPQPGAPVAIGGAAAGDPYILPSLSVSVVLAEVGFRAINVGPNTPIEALEPAVVRNRARLVWRSFSTELAPGELEREHAGLARIGKGADCEIVAGGRGYRTSDGASNVHHFASLAELAGFGRALLPKDGADGIDLL